MTHNISEILAIGSCEPVQADSTHQVYLIPVRGDIKILLLSSHFELYGEDRMNIK